MAEKSTAKTEGLEICRKIEIGTDIWNTAVGHYRPFGKFLFGNLNGSIRFYPHGNDDDGKDAPCSLFVVLTHNVAHETNENDKDRKVTVTIKCGSLIRTFSKRASYFGGGGWGYPDLTSPTHIKANPLIYVTIKMKNDPKFVRPNTFEVPLTKQQELLYKFSKLDGDITLVIKDDATIECQPPKKKRKLNDDNKNISESNGTENEIKCSGIILKSASPVFKNMLSNNMMEKNEKIITVCAKDIKSVDDMIYFMCTNKLRDNTNAIYVMELAHYYQMDRLKYECINKMINTISVDNFVHTINSLDRYSIKDGYATLVEFAKEHIDELKKCDNFDQLSHPFKMIALGLATED